MSTPEAEPAQEQATLLAIQQVANMIRKDGELADALTGKQIRRLAAAAVETALPVIKVAVVVELADNMMTKFPEIGKAMADQAAAFLEGEVNAKWKK